MSKNPLQPNGFNQYAGDCMEFPGAFTTEAEETLGEIKDFDELPRAVQKAIIQEDEN